MSKENLFLGRQGEEEAVSLLKENGYKIIERNYKTKLGEVDIIATDKDTFCFVEVKTRNSLAHGLPVESVSRLKQRQISKATLMFLKERNLLGRKARFDVVSVVYSGDLPKLDLIKNAFELSGEYTY